ncbi:hypothetical protein SAMN05421863_11035 [Nitrosomonas communis]|uniref:Uncharacterized protein n=1 Tax=Nitrosomonas communis TaxID=44574 RepID=A0A1I4W8X9_9PROT|nr:hypothetical protein SAMN05421863_11035 [Nitrosomonas communis]
MKVTLEAQKELFEEYEDHSNYYGQEGKIFSRTPWLI